MLEMDDIIKNCGWTDASVDGLHSIDIPPVQLEVFQNASRWDPAVQAKLVLLQLKNRFFRKLI
jgi:hypothetical protein